MKFSRSGKGGTSMTTCDALESVLSERPRQAAVNHLVGVSTRMASAYLYLKARLGTLSPEHFGLSFEDLALDSCAELFQRDDRGRYVELRTYFESIDLATLDDADLEIALRRIVFSKVGEGLFRRFRENDPNLGKVIRNVKDVAGTTPGVRLERHRRQLWIVIGEDDPLLVELPVAPAEVVEAHVTPALGSSGRTQEAFKALKAFVELHDYYRNGFPVTAFAEIIRSAFIRLGASLHGEPDDEQHFSAEEIARAIDTATDAVRAAMHPSYVGKRKVDGSTFEIYMRTVRDVLESQYVHDTSSTCSHFDVIAGHMPGLSEREYHRRHRNRVEYMIKMARGFTSGILLDEPVLAPAHP